MHGLVTVINYAATNNFVNTFLCAFDAWGSGGERKIASDNNHIEVWFELPAEMWDMLQTSTFAKAFERLGVDLVFHINI